MIPVIGTAYVTRPDLLVAMLQSIRHPVQDIVIVDNAPDDSCPVVDDSLTIKMHRNAGVSAAWNLIIKTRPRAPWWLICNSDITFGPDDLATLEAKMDEGHPLVLLESMASFGISRECVKRVGWFDEATFIPAYCEDNDYIYRTRLMGIEPIFLPSGKTHFGSATLKSSEWARENNDRTYKKNVAAYKAKWGGMMHQEVFTTPYDQGGSPRDCQTLDIDRLAELSWD